mgnify:CR=1 FL=1
MHYKDIELEMREVYGKTTYYPKCETSKMVCELLGQRTITTNNIRTLKKYGYEIYGIREEVAL